MELRRKTYNHLALGIRIVITSVLLALACGVCGTIANAGISSAANRPAYVPNQVLVTLRGGVPETTVANLAKDLGGSIVRRPKYSHTYVVEVPAAVNTKPAERIVAARSTYLQRYSGIQYLEYNCYRYPLAVPNDEFYPSMVDPMDISLLDGQWQMQPASHIYAPEAWDLQKGSKKVVVAVIDTGVRDRYKYNDKGKLVRIIHPDLEGRVLIGYDIADTGQADTNNPGPSPSEVPEVQGGDSTHGTHVAGIIAAQGNNWIGTCGLCWDNVQILPLKVAKDADLSITSADVIDALYAAIQWRGFPDGLDKEPLKVNVVNMSLGSSMPSESEQQVIREAVQSGIVVVAAAGNEYMYGPFAPDYPGAYDEVICVAASGYDDLATAFSNRGRGVDIAAPGWNVLSTVWFRFFASVDTEPDTTTNTSSMNLMGATAVKPSPMPTWPDKYGNTFEYMSGTSMATPHVAAAAALLLSHGVPYQDVRDILQSTATPKGLGRPNDAYGWGDLNMYQALRLASIDTRISSPGKGAVVSSTKPRIRIDFRHASLDSIRVWVDGVDSNGDGVPDNQPTVGGAGPEISNWQQYYYTLDAKSGKTYLLFDYNVHADRAVNGVHKIYVQADSDINFDVPPSAPPVDSDSSQFRVEPQTMASGWRLFSIPATLATPQKPEEILGSQGVLARWNYENTPYGEYAIYSLDRTRTDEEALFTPIGSYASSSVHPVGHTEATPPAGLGYWLYMPASASVQLPEGVGQAVPDAPYVINLSYGWNMVGDPFAFPVDWSTVMVEYAGTRLSAKDAAQQGWLSNSIYRYDPIYARYNFNTLDSALMMPWEAEWVKVKVRTPEVAESDFSAWSDEFNDGVLDASAPEPDWFVGSTYGTVTEAGGMLRLLGAQGQPSYMYVTDKDFPVYKNFALDAKVFLSNVGATVGGGPSNAEIRFRANDTGAGYSLSLKAGDVPSTISLRNSNTGDVIQSKQVQYELTSGSVLYVSVMCVDTHMKIRVGTLPGLADVADWEMDDSTFALPGSFRLVNDGMLDCRWDYFRVRPVTARPADLKLIVSPNAYTGPISK